MSTTRTCLSLAAAVVLVTCMIPRADAAEHRNFAIAGVASAAIGLSCIGVGFGLDSVADARYERFLERTYPDPGVRDADIEEISDTARDAAICKNTGIGLVCVGAGLVAFDFLFRDAPVRPAVRLDPSRGSAAIVVAFAR